MYPIAYYWMSNRSLNQPTHTELITVLPRFFLFRVPHPEESYLSATQVANQEIKLDSFSSSIQSIINVFRYLFLSISISYSYFRPLTGFPDSILTINPIYPSLLKCSFLKNNKNPLYQSFCYFLASTF